MTIKYPTNIINTSTKQPRGTQPRRRPRQYTPKELFVLECARGDHKLNSKGERVGSDGKLPSLDHYNKQVGSGLLLGIPLFPVKGKNW